MFSIGSVTQSSLSIATGVLVYVNQAAERHLGLSREQMLGKVYWDLFPETGEPTVREQYEQAVARMTPVELETISPVTKRIVKQRLHPSASGLTISFRDLSDERQTAQRAERAMSLLVDAGEELSLSLERDEIVRRLTSLVVPNVADVCIVDLLVGETPDPGGGQAPGRAHCPGLHAGRDRTGHSDRGVRAAELSRRRTPRGWRRLGVRSAAAGSPPGPGKTDGGALVADHRRGPAFRGGRPSDDRSLGRSGGPGAGERASLRAGRQRQASPGRDDEHGLA